MPLISVVNGILKVSNTSIYLIYISKFHLSLDHLSIYLTKPEI